MSAFHKCPIHACNVQVPKHMAFCRKHWWMVPKEIRDRICHLFYRESGSRAHLTAIVEGTRAVEAQLLPPTPAIKQAKEDLEAIRRRKRALAKREE